MIRALAIVRDLLHPTLPDRSTAVSQAVAPYRAPGYKEPERMSALDYVTPKARWPLVWLLDIGGYDTVASRSSGQASFTLSGAHDGRAGVRLTCNVPLHEGRLFDKEGTYLVVAIPAADEERVAAILRMAGTSEP